MEKQTLELRGIVSRLERLEKQNRWLKRVCVVSLLLPACIVVMAQANRREAVEAESFVLKDAQGTKRAELAMGRDDASLFFFDAKGQQTSRLSDGFLFLVTPEGSSKTQVGYVILSMANGEPSVILRDRDGFSATLGVADMVVQRIGEQHKTSAASLTLFGKGDKVIWSAP